MNRLLAISIVAFLLGSTVHAQDYAWCGYALIENLPVLENQLAVIAAITPPRSRFSMPHELFQYRYNLSHTKIIIEGCFNVHPRRPVIVALLEQVIEESTTNQPLEIGTEEASARPEQGHVNQRLQYTLFAEHGSREESAAAARAYIQQNITDWEPQERP